jgi:hypothetical protein
VRDGVGIGLFDSMFFSVVVTVNKVWALLPFEEDYVEITITM